MDEIDGYAILLWTTILGLLKFKIMIGRVFNDIGDSYMMEVSRNMHVQLHWEIDLQKIYKCKCILYINKQYKWNDVPKRHMNIIYRQISWIWYFPKSLYVPPESFRSYTIN